MKARSILALMATIIAVHSSLAAEQSIISGIDHVGGKLGTIGEHSSAVYSEDRHRVNVVAQGTARRSIPRRADADLLLVHDPEAEQQFMAKARLDTPANCME